MEKKDDIDNKIINEIKECFSEIDSKLNKEEEDKSNYEITEYFLINNTWLEKYLSLSKKENIFKELIYFILQKMTLSPHKYIYHYNHNNYLYLNNFKIIPKNLLSNFLSIKYKNNNNDDGKKYNFSKIIFKSSKIIVILEEQLSLEILDKNIVPEYLLCFDKNKNINIEQMVNIYLNEMNLSIPKDSENNIVYEHQINNIKITIVNLEKIIEEENIEKNKLSKDNCNKMNQLWTNKYKFQIDKQLNEITNKYNFDFQNQINLNAQILNENLKNQKNKQSKIFEDNYNNSININNKNENIINNNKENNDFEIKGINDNDKGNKISFILDDYIDKNIKINTDNNKDEEKNKNSDKNFNDFLIIDDAKDINNLNSKPLKPLNKEKLNLFISPVLFFLSKINSLIDYFSEMKETIMLYKYVEENTLSEIFLNFLEKLKEEENNEQKKLIFINYSNLILNSISEKNSNKLNKINSPGSILSLFLESLESEQNNLSAYIKGDPSIIDLMVNKKEYDIYNEQEMFQKLINNSLNRKSFIYEKFYIIIKNTKQCKICNMCSYEFQTFPTLDIYLNKSKDILKEDNSDFEMVNTMLCKVSFPDNIAQLLSPTSLKKQISYCKNCGKYNEINFNKYISVLKKYLIINIDRENDPKNEMIFIYPETLDLKNQSKYNINLYQLRGVICKKVNENNYNIDDIDNDISKYFCYFKKSNENKWICFDENYNLYELENNNEIFNFKNVAVLFYSKIEDE